MRVLALLALVWPMAAGAEGLQSNCQALASADAVVQPVAFGAPLATDTLRIRYLAHAEFALETPGGVLAITDFNGLIGNADVVPDVVTMNHAHDTHFTMAPDPRIAQVLHGWPVNGRAAYIDLQLGDLRIRNVTTDTRGPFGEGAERDGNSIFLFEAAGLCVAHLGHLHQVPSPVQLASIGRVDVVMLPIDGGFTMNLDAMKAVVGALHARVVVPMHWFTQGSLVTFLGKMAEDYDLKDLQGPEVEISLQNLPERPAIWLLTPALIP
jgi:L-ascorbate metabolism protein UlaG (beta-lactamase superfamily)